MRVGYYPLEEVFYVFCVLPHSSEGGGNINQRRQFLYHYFLIIVHVISS